MMKRGFGRLARHGGFRAMDRMMAENDFALIDPVFSPRPMWAARGQPSARTYPALKDARSIADLQALDVIVTCQGRRLHQ